MPTGYTAYIEDGSITTAEDFIMLCARAFGVCISMRDEPLSKPIPQEFAESSFYRDALEQEHKRLSYLRNMTDAEIHEQNESEYQKRVAKRESSVKKDEELKSRYLGLLAKVKDWNPPTPEHDGLKKFCIEQIQMSLPDPRYYDSPIEKLPDDEWIKTNIRYCLKAIARYEKEAKEEAERTASRNKWLKDLRDSLQNI